MVTIHHKEIMGGKAAHVIVEGPLNGSAAVDLEEYAGGLLSKGIRTVVIDAGKIEYVSSAGIGAFVIINKKLRGAGGTLVIFSLNDETATLFRLLGFDGEISVVRGLSEAMAAATAPHAGRTPSVHEELAPTGPVAEAPVVFENPIIVECRRCGTLVRVKKSGDYGCPDCGTEFTVMNDMTVNF